MNVGDSDFSGALGDLISSFINGLHTYSSPRLWNKLCASGSYCVQVLIRSPLMSVSKPVLSLTGPASTSISQHRSKRINVQHKDALCTT